MNALYAINLYRITFDEWLAGEETSEQEFNERYRPKVAEALRRRDRATEAQGKEASRLTQSPAALAKDDRGSLDGQVRAQKAKGGPEE